MVSLLAHGDPQGNAPKLPALAYLVLASICWGCGVSPAPPWPAGKPLPVPRASCSLPPVLPVPGAGPFSGLSAFSLCWLLILVLFAVIFSQMNNFNINKLQGN